MMFVAARERASTVDVPDGHVTLPVGADSLAAAGRATGGGQATPPTVARVAIDRSWEYAWM